MSSERWILIGISDPATLPWIKKSIQKAGHRATVVSSVTECAEMIARRTFLCAFFDLPFFAKAAKTCPFVEPTYITLVAKSNEISRTLALQEKGKVHDWLTMPPREEEIRAILLRARTFLRMAGELEGIKASTARSVGEDSDLLCAGSWAKSATRWIKSVRTKSDPLLLIGEPGTGKQLLAQKVHYESSRSSAPFFTVLCRNRDIRELEKEIFGEIAPRKRISTSPPARSIFALAANGTVLFDKVETLSRRVQQRIANTILSRSFSPVGGGDRLKMDARLIFTIQKSNGTDVTKRLLHPDLARLLKKGTLLIPPLRKRKGDFSILVARGLERLSRMFDVQTAGITDDAIELLKKHDWPGNIRELEGVIWAACIVAGPAPISTKTLAPFLGQADEAMADEEEALEAAVENKLSALFRQFGVEHLKDLHPMILERVERPLLSLVLQHTNGNQVRAAQVLGINRNTLRRKMTERKIAPPLPSQGKLL